MSALVSGLVTGAGIGGLVFALWALVFDAPLRETAALAAGAAVGGAAVAGLVALGA